MLYEHILLYTIIVPYYIYENEVTSYYFNYYYIYMLILCLSICYYCCYMLFVHLFCFCCYCLLLLLCLLLWRLITNIVYTIRKRESALRRKEKKWTNGEKRKPRKMKECMSRECENERKFMCAPGRGKWDRTIYVLSQKERPEREQERETKRRRKRERRERMKETEMKTRKKVLRMKTRERERNEPEPMNTNENLSICKTEQHLYENRVRKKKERKWKNLYTIGRKKWNPSESSRKKYPERRDKPNWKTCRKERNSFVMVSHENPCLFYIYAEKEKMRERDEKSMQWGKQSTLKRNVNENEMHLVRNETEKDGNVPERNERKRKYKICLHAVARNVEIGPKTAEQTCRTNRMHVERSQNRW